MVEISIVELLVGFGLLVAGSFAGTTLALRAYHDDESFSPDDVFRVGDE